MFAGEKEEKKKPTSSKKFFRQTRILMWKSYLQRQRRWRLLLIETIFGVTLFVIAAFIARPVFLTPLQEEPTPALTTSEILSTVHSKTLLGYAPNVSPYSTIMAKAAAVLNKTALAGNKESDLNELLYNMSRGTPLKIQVMWVIFKSESNNKWKFSIRSTERARYGSRSDVNANPHLRAGFLAVQVAISKAILEHVTPKELKYEINLVSMPVSPLMQENRVTQALSIILLCFTLALLPAILETEALVVWETKNMFKRALRMRNVSYTSMYWSWLVYAYLTALPVCILGAITMILIFRWIHLVTALLLLLAYVSVMAMVAFIMAMFHNRAHIACIWTTLFTLLQMYLAELLVHHQYDLQHVTLTFVLKVLVPPLGLIHAFNEFALLSTGHSSDKEKMDSNIKYMVASWGLLITVYFGLLMLLQRTIGQQRAIGGQVSWRSIIFKKAEDRNKLRHIEKPTCSERGKLQEVDELVAKAISFRDVCKVIMDVPMLHNLTFDIYRAEYTVILAERIQTSLLETLDDIMTGLTLPDRGEVRVLGEVVGPESALLNTLYMLGYCHRSETLIDDLTVEEHFTLFSVICIWYQSMDGILEYGQIRSKYLLKECNLLAVCDMRVRDLDLYYRAQLCWALAMLLEPRVIIVPYFQDEPVYKSVIVDKITKFRKQMTIVSFISQSLNSEYADRVFIFDHKLLVFGGTPAYLFYQYGREYRVRLAFKVCNIDSNNDEYYNLLKERVQEIGGTVRAHFGSLIILRIPAIPTAPFAALITDLTDNASKYGITPVINITVPDTEETFKRAVNECRAAAFQSNHAHTEAARTAAKAAVKRMIEPSNWEKSISFHHTHFKQIARKFIAFHKHHKILSFLTFVSAMGSGLLLGWSLCSFLYYLDSTKGSYKMLKSEVLSVEHLKIHTNLVLRTDNSSKSISIAEAYVMSDTGATKKETNKMAYIALPHSESLREYLVMRAIDSPQNYVFIYAYGMEVASIDDDIISIQALYSPLNNDKGAAARSLARVYMALIRYYTGQLSATIQVTDDPLALDLSPWIKELAEPPLFLQFLLILTLSHITLLPSMEYGLVRHVQKHAADFSPARYWFTLYICDMLLLWLIVLLISVNMIGTIFITARASLLEIYDMLVLPLMLMLYGMCCIPQAYIFSLGPTVQLNIMSFVIVNMVFGETTIVAKLLYGDAMSFAFALWFLNLCPQFNMAYAFVKIRQIFLYNTECTVLKAQNLCSNNAFHKCCHKCGVLQECFKRKTYLSAKTGILPEVISMLSTSVLFTVLLLLIEYRVFDVIWKTICKKLHKTDNFQETLNPGIQREMIEVLEKKKTVASQRDPHSIKVNTFGEHLCAEAISLRETGRFVLRNIYLGLGRGEVLAISGLKLHGRLNLLEVLSGYILPSNGNLWAMSKWNCIWNPHMYSRQVSFSCEHRMLPPWLTVKQSLELIGTLRGVPSNQVAQEAHNLLEALECTTLANTVTSHIVLRNELTRINFAACVIGAPPVIIVDEVTAWQKFSVRRTIYGILYMLRKRGHAIMTMSSGIEGHMPLTSRRLGFLLDGTIFDIDSVDNLVERYNPDGYTVVVHLKDEVDVIPMFANYFEDFKINDYSEVLVNVQIFDKGLDYKILFQKMEALVADNDRVYSYICTTTAIDYIFNNIKDKEKGLRPATGFFSWRWTEKIISSKVKKKPTQDELNMLKPFQKKYEVTKLNVLPWSVIFHTNRDDRIY